MNKVFVDSGGWIACIDKNDKHHKEAVEYFKNLREKGNTLITSNYIKSETLTWLKYNVNHEIALKVMDLWRQAEKINSLETYWISQELAEEADEIFKKYGDQSLSYIDCTSFAICRKLNIQKVFGFDSDFNTLGYLLAPHQVKEKGYSYNILIPERLIKK